MSIVGLWSGKNYLKHALADSVTINKPNTADGALFFSSTTILHNLGYIPLVKCAFDGNNDGTIFPGVGQKDNDSIAGFVGAPFTVFTDEITTTTVTFRAEKSTAPGGTFVLYYRIYIDPTL